MIDLFVFDLGGVLVNEFDVIPEASRRLGVAEPDLRKMLLPDMDAYMSGLFEAEGFWDRFRSRTGIRVPENYWATLFRPVLNHSVEALVLALKAYGRVVCGTNTIDVHYDWLAAAGYYGCFDAVYASHLLGVSKPRPEFWLRILEAEGRTPDRAYFTDDMEENVLSASALGIRSHRFAGAPGLAADLEAAGFSVLAPEACP